VRGITVGSASGWCGLLLLGYAAKPGRRPLRPLRFQRSPCPSCRARPRRHGPDPAGRAVPRTPRMEAFRSFERRLPIRERGYYREVGQRWHRRAAGSGARRLVAARGGEFYYTERPLSKRRRIRDFFCVSFFCGWVNPERKDAGEFADPRQGRGSTGLPADAKLPSPRGGRDARRLAG